MLQEGTRKMRHCVSMERRSGRCARSKQVRADLNAQGGQRCDTYASCHLRVAKLGSASADPQNAIVARRTGDKDGSVDIQVPLNRTVEIYR